MKPAFISLFAISLCSMSCANSDSSTKLPAADTMVQELRTTVTTQIEAAGKTFTIIDSLVGSHTLLETLTMREYFGMEGDTVRCSILVTDSSGKMDELIVYHIAKAAIDPAESYVEGISFGDKNARMLTLLPPAGQQFSGIHHKQDGSASPLQVEKVEISFDDATKADRIAQGLGIKL